MVNLENNTNFILEIQNHLNNVNHAWHMIELTGVYDQATRNAVLIFQNANGLPPTGYVDVPTWAVLASKNNEYLRKTQMPGKITVSNPEFKDVKTGDQNDLVYGIKVMFNNFSRRYANYPELEVTNLYDEKTEEAVILFQQRSMLPVTGIVDLKTWNSFCKIYEVCRLYEERH